MTLPTQYIIRTLLLILLLFASAHASGRDDSHNCITGVAVKSNMLHDLLLTPDLGVEVSLHNKFSVSAEGVWAWWSRHSANRCWRIYGGSVEGRYWFGRMARQSTLSGHHVGIYVSVHSFDFEFGGKGWQSPGLTFGVGGSYGYSFPISSQLNIDVSASVGYSAGDLTTYRPQCGKYVCISRKYHRYFGLTGLAVTLVWFPKFGTINNRTPQ